MTRRAFWVVLLAVGAGCGSDQPATVGTPAGGTDGGDPSTSAGSAAPGAAGTGGDVDSAGSGGSGRGPAPDGLPIPLECRGFSFEGILYSPGGTALPNTCEPFHPTTNNPYAVRCVDVWPWYQTDFPGDEYCILPPEPGKGIQYGVHPQGKDWFAQVSTGDLSGYDDPGDEWVMDDGQEEEGNYLTGVETPESNFYRSYNRMRPGSHHMIVSSAMGGTQETWGPGSPDGLFGGTSLPGAQRPDENVPKVLEKPAEDAGLYSVLPANTAITFNMHHFNATGAPIMKEAWTNLWWEEDATVRVNPIFGLELRQVATLSVPPNTSTDLHYSWTINQPMRLIALFGHRHAWTTNFTSWVEKENGELEILYQSFDWFDEPTYRYDSLTQNPPPAPEMLVDGAASGLRMLNAGEKLHFNCHIEFTDERAVAENAPMPAEIGTLRFANQAFTAEMCILFGSTSGGRLTNPPADPGPLPDFATID